MLFSSSWVIYAVLILIILLKKIPTTTKDDDNNDFLKYVEIDKTNKTHKNPSTHKNNKTDVNNDNDKNEDETRDRKIMATPLKYIFKILLIGAAETGKTSLLRCYDGRAFEEKYDSTVGVDFIMPVKCLNGIHTKLQIWDTAGADKFRTITTAYFRGCHVAIMVFDVTSPQSLADVENRLKDVQQFCEANVVKFLVATKCDLVDSRVITKENAEKFANPTTYIISKHQQKIIKVFLIYSNKVLYSPCNSLKTIPTHFNDHKLLYVDNPTLYYVFRFVKFFMYL